MIYKEWHDIAVFNDRDRVLTREQRLDTSQALDVPELATARDMMAWWGDEEQAAQRHEELRARGWRLTLKTLLFDPEGAFEAMQITDFGFVTIWTRKYVGTLHHPSTTMIEKLWMVPRNPPQT